MMEAESLSLKGNAVRPFLLCALAVATMAVASLRDSYGLLNPHIKPEPCGSCHTKVPTEAEGNAGDYFLLKDAIDDTTWSGSPPI